MNCFTNSKARGEERRREEKGERRGEERRGEERRGESQKTKEDRNLDIIRTVAVFRWVNITSYSYISRHRPYL